MLSSQPVTSFLWLFAASSHIHPLSSADHTCASSPSSSWCCSFAGLPTSLTLRKDLSACCYPICKACPKWLYGLCRKSDNARGLERPSVPAHALPRNAPVSLVKFLAGGAVTMLDVCLPRGDWKFQVRCSHPKLVEKQYTEPMVEQNLKTPDVFWFLFEYML